MIRKPFVERRLLKEVHRWKFVFFHSIFTENYCGVSTSQTTSSKERI